MYRSIGLAISAAMLAAPIAVDAQTSAPPPAVGEIVLKGMVTAQGRISFGNGIGAVGIKDTGLYRVTLNRSTSLCAFTVTVGGATPGYATVDYTKRDTTATQVDVHVFDGTGAPANLPFFFTANCAASATRLF